MSPLMYAHLEQEPPCASERRPELGPRSTASSPERWRRSRKDGKSRCGDLVDEAREALGLSSDRAGDA